MRFCFTSSISIGSKRGHCRLHFGVTLQSSALEGFSNISFQNCCSVSGGHLEPPSSCHWPDRTDLVQRDLFELQSFCVQAKRAFRCARLRVGSFGLPTNGNQSLMLKSVLVLATMNPSFSTQKTPYCCYQIIIGGQETRSPASDGGCNIKRQPQPWST